MKVDFYRANEQNAPTVEHYLFSDEYALIMNGQYIEQAGKHYQVISQTIPDLSDYPETEEFRNVPALMCFIYPVSNTPTIVNL